MPVTNYKIWGIGSPVGIGVTKSFHVGVAGIAKSNLPGPPTTVANELVCNRLANVLLLPAQPGFTIEHNGQLHFVSLNFNLAGHGLPPANCTALVAALPLVSAGILLFDMWVANWDRHRGNLNFDTTSGRAQIFDHSHALLGDGVAALPGKVNDCGIGPIGRHCVANELVSTQHLSEWAKRIESIPEYYIRTVLADVAVPEFGVTAADADACAQFLIDRRPKLIGLMLANKGHFPKVLASEWSTLVP